MITNSMSAQHTQKGTQLATAASIAQGLREACIARRTLFGRAVIRARAINDLGLPVVPSDLVLHIPGLSVKEARAAIANVTGIA